MTTTHRPDIYHRITQHIMADLERGTRPWLRPWSTDHAASRITRPLRHNGQPYQGINILMLWAEAATHGYTAPVGMTFRQAQVLGGQVRRGERGATVVYADRITRTETADDGSTEEREIPFLKAYHVFNAEQIDGLPAQHYAAPPALALPEQRIGGAENFLRATGATIRHGGDRAYYAIGPDHIQLPPFVSFRDPESYYATALHELTHWTRHPSRLDRDLGRKRWGDAGYAAEELVAELGAAFLCADLGITPQPRDDHAAYIAAWLTMCANDARAIVTAAARAQQAVHYLHRLQPSAVPVVP